VNARRDIVDGLTDEEVRECMLQLVADNDEHRWREHSERGTPDTVENAIRPLVVKLKLGTEPRESLLAELFMRDEHVWANHPRSEEASDPPDAYIRSLVERVRTRGHVRQGGVSPQRHPDP
jgi:hypothetical protein